MADTVYTRKQILELPPGQELERIIEERLFGRRVELRAVEVGGAFTGRYELGSWHGDRFKGVPRYSRDDAAMGLVLDALMPRRPLMHLTCLSSDENTAWRCLLKASEDQYDNSGSTFVFAATRPLAVARAAALFLLGLSDGQIYSSRAIPSEGGPTPADEVPDPDAAPVEAPRRRGRPPKQRTEEAPIEATQTVTE